MLRAVSQVLAEAMQAADPAAYVRGQLERGDLSAEERAALAGVCEDGLGLARMLVAKLRFERLLLGDPRLGVEFGADPEGFSRSARAYFAATPRGRCWPREEAAAFRAWREGIRTDEGADNGGARRQDHA